MQREILKRLNEDRAAARSVALVTEMESGTQALVYPDGAIHGAALSPTLIREAIDALAADKSMSVTSDERELFIQVHNPPLRMFIVGAVHITQALAEMARITGYAVTVIDPRRAFAETGRFPGIEVTTEWPDDALKRLAIDTRTAIVTLSHDPKIDDPALHIALRSPAFYVGSLGSKRTHGKRLARLAENGFSDAEVGRICSPVGLDIGAKSPAEIAVSIMAQVTEARRRGQTAARGQAA